MLLFNSFLLPVEILLQTIIDSCLSSSYCLTIVSEENLRFNFAGVFIYIEPDITVNFTSQLLIASEQGCSDYIVRMKDPKAFMLAFDKVVHLGTVRRSDRKIIFLPFTDLSAESNKDNLFGILPMMETSFVANILLILPTEEANCSLFDLVTHKFVGQSDHHKPIYLDKWNFCSKSFEQQANLFPHDMTNLQGKPVKVACFTYTPYVILDLDTAISPHGRDGMEIRIVDEFCRWVNCTVQLVRDDEHEWGEYYENLTGVGVIGNVVEDRADMGITALYSWYEEFVVMDFSVSCIRTAITAIAPSPRLLASWEMPLMPFTTSMWLALFCTLLYACVALTIAQGCSTDRVFLTTFGMMVTQSQPESRSSWRIRSVTGWLLITGLVLDNAYGGGLAATFTLPKYEKSIDTIQDIIDRNVEWGATHDAWIFSIILSEEPQIKQLVSQFRVYSAEELKRRSFSRSMAYSIEKLPAGSFAIGDYITQEAVLDYSIMLEKFYYEQCVVILRKSSLYTAKISELVGRLHESGLLLAWETQVALKHLDFKVQLEVKLSRSKRDVENIEPLGFTQVVGVFILYGIGVAISSFLFLLEMMIYRRKIKQSGQTL